MTDEAKTEALRKAIREFLGHDGDVDELFHIAMGVLSEGVPGIALLEPAHLMIGGDDWKWPDGSNDWRWWKWPSTTAN